MKYEVMVKVIGYASAVIEAESAEEAISFAEDIDYHLYSERYEIMENEVAAMETVSIIECDPHAK